MNDVYKVLKKEIYPKIESCYSVNDFYISLARVFEVLPGCTYTEYYTSFTNGYFRLVNATYEVNTFVYTYLSFGDFLKYYPDAVDFRKFDGGSIPADVKILNREDLKKPLRKVTLSINDVCESNKAEIALDTNNKVTSANSNLYTSDFVNKIQSENIKLKQENQKLREQIKDLSNNILPKSVVTDKLIEIFNE